jgi:deoxyribose-phosphate aldolase
MQSSELDRLVDEITSRVRARLGGGEAAAGLAEGRPSHSESCGGCALPSCTCESCGLNPSSALSSVFAPPVSAPSPAEMARFIDHTHLKPDADRAVIEKLCDEARKHGFFSVCVNSGNVHLAARRLVGSETKVCAVVGFPLGAGTPGAKAFEAREAVRCGATEIDMVMNIGALRSREYALVLEDIARVVKSVPGKLVKVILETGMLQDEEKAIACALSKASGAHFVKTSTGFAAGGATVADIALMRRLVGPDMGVKASGGVKDYPTAVALLRAGANRLGASSSVAIVTGGKGGGGGY